MLSYVCLCLCVHRPSRTTRSLAVPGERESMWHVGQYVCMRGALECCHIHVCVTQHGCCAGVLL